jgi:hypothetical protein
MAYIRAVNDRRVASLLPEAREEWKYWPTAPKTYWGYAGFFRSVEEVRGSLGKLEELKKR